MKPINRTRVISRDRHGSWRGLRRTSPVVAIAATLGLTVNACGGGDAGTRATPTSSVPAAGEPDPLAFAQCMRDNGIANFPDPDPSADDEHIQSAKDLVGTGGSDPESLGLDPESPQFKAAEEACEHLLPPQDPADRPEFDPLPASAIDALLRYAQCMRDEGINNHPDPDAYGRFALDDALADSPQFGAADEACKHLLPDGGEGGGRNQAGADG